MRLTDGFIYLIEANSLPALTPSTVLFQQALVHDKPMMPRELLEYIIRTAVARNSDAVTGMAEPRHIPLDPPLVR
jgi:hypothetical protein